MMDLFDAHHQAHCGQPLVSVLIPSYNHERFVLECLNSIKHLDYPRLELILSDDCSTDSTYVLAKRWIEDNAGRFERCVAVKQSCNLGIVRQLQFLFNSAQGDYIAYLASDDLLVSSSVLDRVRILEEWPEFDAVFGDAEEISETGRIVKERHISPDVVREFESMNYLAASLIIHFRAPGPCMLLRRQAVLADGSLGLLPEDLKVEDRYIYVRLAAKKKLTFLNKVVGQYRIVPGGATTAEYFNNHVVLSDKYNRHLLKGLGRIAIETKIARNQLESDIRKPAAAHYLSKLLLRGVTAILTAWVRIGSLLFKVPTRRESKVALPRPHSFP